LFGLRAVILAGFRTSFWLVFARALSNGQLNFYLMGLPRGNAENKKGDRRKDDGMTDKRDKLQVSLCESQMCSTGAAGRQTASTAPASCHRRKDAQTKKQTDRWKDRVTNQTSYRDMNPRCPDKLPAQGYDKSVPAPKLTCLSSFN
jgi:hypothetical protein